MRKSVTLALFFTAALSLLSFPALDSVGAQRNDPRAEGYIDENLSPTLRDALKRESDSFFSDSAFGETRALVIMQDGEIIAERYAPGYSPKTRFISWSMAKTVTAVLTGLMVADGRLALDEPAPVPAWQNPGDPRRDITLRHLLQMRSGLNHTEAGSPVYKSDEVRMLFLDGRSHMARYAEGQPLEAEVGSKFEYSSNTSVILADILTRQLTGSKDPQQRMQAMRGFIRGRLAEPLGMDSLYPEFDASGTLIGGSIIHATARDWARFGEFLRNGGAVDGSQILPRGWVRFMLTPSPAEPAYGGQIWLNRKHLNPGSDTLFPDQGPASIFAAVGHLGQYIIVSPEQNLVLVRLGKTDNDDRKNVQQQLGKIAALFPSG